jgi:8-oxo-dGTP pyrophosphatase MutT (NUDIX family)
MPRPTLVDRCHRLALQVAWRGLVLYWRVFRPDTFGVCVAVWSGGRLLLVRHSYRPGAAIPSGMLHRGEAPEAAAARELREEVGIAASPGGLRAAGQIVSLEHGNRDHLSFFELECSAEPAVNVDGREIVWAAFHTPAEALALDLVPPLRSYLAGRADRKTAP